MKRHFAWLGPSMIVTLVAAGLGARAELPTPAPISDELVKQATAEGKVVFYTVELVLAEDLSKLFRAKYPGISGQVERTGSKRVFLRRDRRGLCAPALEHAAAGK